MNSRDDILDRLRQIKPELQAEFPLHRLALFGSWARNQQSEESDVDILVEVDPSIGLRFVTLADRLEHAINRPADVVSRRAIRESYWKKIEPELIDA